MIDITITISGVDTQVARMGNLEGIALDAAKDGMSQALIAMADVLADYPPELPNQKYVRTYTLYDGWIDTDPVFQAIPSGLAATLTNPTEYGPQVEGDATQEAIFQGRWPTVGQVQQAQAEAARDAVAAAVDEAVRRG